MKITRERTEHNIDVELGQAEWARVYYDGRHLIRSWGCNVILDKQRHVYSLTIKTPTKAAAEEQVARLRAIIEPPEGDPE